MLSYSRVVTCRRVGSKIRLRPISSVDLCRIKALRFLLWFPCKDCCSRFWLSSCCLVEGEVLTFWNVLLARKAHNFWKSRMLICFGSQRLPVAEKNHLGKIVTNLFTCLSSPVGFAIWNCFTERFETLLPARGRDVDLNFYLHAPPQADGKSHWRGPTSTS